MISLRGNFWFILNSLLLFLSAAVYVTIRRLVRGPHHPNWGWRIEVAFTYLRWQGGQAAQRKRIQDQRAFNNALAFRPDFGRGMNIQTVNMGKVPARRFTPEKTNRVTMLYLHGGGYVFYNRSGDQLIGHIAEAAQADTWVPDYRLAPENPYPAALEDTVEAYRSLIDSKVDPQHLIIAGDSAGGGLAVATLLRASQMGLPMPSLVILLCPWIDLALRDQDREGKSMRSRSATDFITIDQLRTWSLMYAGRSSLADPLISPKYAVNLKGLPPFVIQAGRDEILSDSIVEFAVRAKAQGVEVTLDLFPEMPHDFQAFAYHTPQSTLALQRIRREVWRRMDNEPPQVQQCRPDLGIFRANVKIPYSVFEMIWRPLGLSKTEIEDILTWLTRHEIITGNPGQTFSLAPNQLAGLHFTNHPARHKRLVDGYKALCHGNWVEGPQDGYFFENLAYHLQRSDNEEELNNLLLNFDWLWAQLQATNIKTVIADFGYLKKPDTDHQYLLEALTLSEKVLEQDKNQLPAQLRGRLLWYVNYHNSIPRPGLLARIFHRNNASTLAPSALPGLLNRISRWNRVDWFCPVKPSLIGPLSPREGRETSPGMAVVISANQQRALAVLDDRIQVWNAKRGTLLASLNGHRGMIYSMAISGNGALAVSGGEDSTVRIWDLDACGQLLVFGGEEGHVGRVWSVALTPNGKWAASVGEDGMLMIWDLRKGCRYRALQAYDTDIRKTTPLEDANPLSMERIRGHLRGAGCVAITPNGRMAVTGGADGSVRVWDLKKGQEKYVFKDHQAGVGWVGISWHGRRAYSISYDRQLKVWDLDRNRLMMSLNWPLDPDSKIKDAVKKVLTCLDVPMYEKVADKIYASPRRLEVVQLLDTTAEALEPDPINRDIVWALKEFKTVLATESRKSELSWAASNAIESLRAIPQKESWDAIEELLFVLDKSTQGKNLVLYLKNLLGVLGTAPQAKDILNWVEKSLGALDADAKKKEIIQVLTEVIDAFRTSSKQIHLNLAMDELMASMNKEAAEGGNIQDKLANLINVLRDSLNNSNPVSAYQARRKKYFQQSDPLALISEFVALLKTILQRKDVVDVVNDFRQLLRKAENEKISKDLDVVVGEIRVCLNRKTLARMLSKDLEKIRNSTQEANLVGVLLELQTILKSLGKENLGPVFTNLIAPFTSNQKNKNEDSIVSLICLMDALRLPPLEMMTEALTHALNVYDLSDAVRVLDQNRDPLVRSRISDLMLHLGNVDLKNLPDEICVKKISPYVLTSMRRLLNGLNIPLKNYVELLLAAPNDFAVAVANNAAQAVLPIRAHVLEWANLETGDRYNLGSHAHPIWACAIDSDGKQAISASLDSTLKLWDLKSKNCLATYFCNGEVTFCAMSPYGQMIVAGDQAGFLHFLRPVLPG